MKKRIFLIFPLIPLVTYLYMLFFVHYDGKVRPKYFEHKFDPFYSIGVRGLDYDILDKALNQPYHFLGKGKQMLALESEDGRYVIKLFNPMRPLKKGWYKSAKFWRRYCSLKWISREWFTKNQRFNKLFFRHKIAFEHLKEETGLLFVHLSPSPRVIHYLHVTDQRGKKQIFSLADTPFVLQEKAVLVPQYLSNLLRHGEQEKAVTALLKLETLLKKRVALGITDRIQTMENNYGFVGDRPIQIDVGRICPIEDRAGEQPRILDSFHAWIGAKYPKLLL